MNDAICSIGECGTPAKARGWCDKHWKRWRKHGDPTARRRSPDERFAEKAEPLAWSGCHIWTAGLVPDGYGRFELDGRNMSAHTYAWERQHGPVPDGMELDHKCHVRSCVNPDHLRLSTVSENRAHLQGARRDRKHHLPRGVYRNGRSYMARVQYRGENVYCGTFPTVDEASVAADSARRELFGEFAGKGMTS